MDGITRRRRQSGDTCNCLRPIIRFWGLITAIVCCGVGADVTVNGHKFGSFILVLSIFVLFLEIKWIVTLFVQLLFASDHTSNCVHCWSICKLFGGWRLSPFYIAFGVALILWPLNLWLSYVAGCQLVILAILRLLTLIRFSRNLKDEGLLPQNDFENEILDEEEFNEVRTSLEEEEPIDEDEE